MAHARTAAGEWRTHWPLVLAAMAGFSLQGVAASSIGLFMEPLGREFGWGRAEISAGLMIPALFLIAVSPVVGALVDRWGSRRLAIPGLVLTGFSLAAFGFANGSHAQWLGLWVCYAVFSVFIKATLWTSAVTGCFSSGRGLALGVTLCGGAVAQVLCPPLAQVLIAAHGWREAYFWIAAGWTTPCLVLAVLFLRDAHDHARRTGPAVPASPAAEYGLGFKEALGDPALIRIGAATVLTMFAGTSALVHQVPILVEAGVSRADAAWLASLGGIAGVVGKLVTGWLMDRWNSGPLAAITLAAPAIGFAMLLQPFGSAAVIVAAMVIIGYASGSKLQLTAYLTGRYAGTRNFGKIFGVMNSLVALGGGLGPVAAGAIYDVSGSYAPLLTFGVAGSLVCGLLVYRLGPYPDWQGSPPVADAAVGPLGPAVPARPER